MKPWNDWYHCMGNTHATWLPGSNKGFRTRHHREHVEGDYKNPPPAGKYDALYQSSKSRMKRPAVYLSMEQRIVVCRALGEAFLHYGTELVELCVTDKHVHLLARFTGCTGAGLCEANSLKDGRDPLPRVVFGRAKSWSSHQLVKAGLFPADIGGIWAVRTKEEPISGREHQLSTVGYIRDHVEEGGVIWTHLRNKQ